MRIIKVAALCVLSLSLAACTTGPGHTGFLPAIRRPMDSGGGNPGKALPTPAAAATAPPTI